MFLFQWHFLRHKKKEEVGRRNVCKKTMKSRPREQDDARYPKAVVCLGIKQIKDINKTSVTLVFRFDEHGWFTLIQHSFFLSTENSQALHRVYEAQTCLGYVHKEDKLSLSSQSHFLFLEPSTYFWPRHDGYSQKPRFQSALPITSSYCPPHLNLFHLTHLPIKPEKGQLVAP